MRKCQCFEVVHVSKNDVKTRSFDLDIWDSEIGEILKLREPDSGDSAEAVDAGEGSERWDELRREVDRWDWAVDEVEWGEGGEWFEGCEWERDVGGTVGEG